MTAPGDLSLADRLARIETKLDQVVEHVTILRVKAGLYGGLGAAVVAAAAKLLGVV